MQAGLPTREGVEEDQTAHEAIHDAARQLGEKWAAAEKENAALRERIGELEHDRDKWRSEYEEQAMWAGALTEMSLCHQCDDRRDELSEDIAARTEADR